MVVSTVDGSGSRHTDAPRPFGSTETRAGYNAGQRIKAAAVDRGSLTDRQQVSPEARSFLAEPQFFTDMQSMRFDSFDRDI